MKKPDEQIKSALREDYGKACNNYLAVLLKMWELDSHYGYWNSDRPGTIYHYGDTHNLSMGEIIYIVENDIEEEEVFKWEDYCLKAHEFGLSTPNLRSWHMGCHQEIRATIQAVLQEAQRKGRTRYL